MPVRCSIALRIKEETESPGTSTGFWKDMNMPALARLSAGSSSIFCPLKRISPSVTSYRGFPIRAKPSVDLPAPLGPISTCVSPLPIVRSTPFKISLSCTLTCRSFTSSMFWLMYISLEFY